jgi:hypothetical protein
MRGMLRLSKKTDLLLGVHDVRHCVFAEELVVALQDSARTGSGHKNRSHPITHCTNAIIAVRSLRRIVQAISRHRGDGRCPACPAPRNAARQSERRSSHIGTILAFTLAALLFVHARFSRFRNPAFMRLPPPRPQQRERAPSAARCGARTHSTSASARLPRSQCTAGSVLSLFSKFSCQNGGAWNRARRGPLSWRLGRNRIALEPTIVRWSAASSLDPEAGH